MKTIQVQTGRPYTVQLGHGLLDTAGETLRALCPKAKRAVIVTEDRVRPLYARRLMDSLTDAGLNAFLFSFAPGEDHKTLDTLGKIYEFMAQAQITRTDCLVTLGGGIPGDVGGFAAATYLRGIDYLQIPTTFLSQIDSSVGGKTAVNIPAGKNLVGAFWQPVGVLCDMDTLDTLSESDFSDGTAEALKYGMIDDRDLFFRIRDRLHEDLEDIIYRCISIKRDFVERDERDHGDRMLLNFGHTLGHAIEKHSGHRISHGKAVAIGMNLITKLTVSMGMTAPETAAVLEETCRSLGLPTDYPAPLGELLDFILLDKKRTGDMVKLIVSPEIGKAQIYPMPVQELRRLGE